MSIRLVRPGHNAQASPWIQYAFDRAYKLHEMWVWNANQLVESFIGFGAKDVTIETSTDGVDWLALGNVPPFSQATSAADYTANTIVDFAGTVARYVRITINTGWGTIPQYGLSEVRFFFIPTYPREPQPLDGTVTNGAQVVLDWRAGREAASHEVYLGTDAQDLALISTTTESDYDPGALDYGTTYYWSVTEVNEAETVSAYAGDTWSFSTPPYSIVDDFDQYDDLCNRIFFAWEDGLGHNGGTGIDNCDVAPFNGNGGGSIVGNNQAPFAERTLVNTGSRQSLPFNYDNAQDDSGLGNHGTLVGDARFADDVDRGGVLNVNGIDAVVEVPHAPSIGFNDATNLTLAVWVKPAQLPRSSWTAVMAKNRDVSPDAAYGIWISTSNNWHFRFGPTAGDANVSGAPGVTEEWHSVIMTHDAATTTLRGYLDGWLIYENTNSDPTPLTAQSPLWIGGAESVNEYGRLQSAYSQVPWPVKQFLPICPGHVSPDQPIRQVPVITAHTTQYRPD